LPDSRLVARKVADRRRLLCASPDYLARHGTPQSPQDLARHDCLCFTERRDPYRWSFQAPEEARSARQSRHASPRPRRTFWSMPRSQAWHPSHDRLVRPGRHRRWPSRRGAAPLGCCGPRRCLRGDPRGNGNTVENACLFELGPQATGRPAMGQPLWNKSHIHIPLTKSANGSGADSAHRITPSAKCWPQLPLHPPCDATMAAAMRAPT
jgi:hypothetical protein